MDATTAPSAYAQRRLPAPAESSLLFNVVRLVLEMAGVACFSAQDIHILTRSPDCSKAANENKIPDSTCACGKRAEGMLYSHLICLSQTIIDPGGQIPALAAAAIATTAAQRSRRTSPPRSKQSARTFDENLHVDRSRETSSLASEAWFKAFMGSPTMMNWTAPNWTWR